ncbi:ATP-binding protein [Bacillus horti]|uniref:hybrid sensor histidine kinase/response regulator n=1 Tax=Caldalkalibacillus horti TaxID=77523 RepID=UPI0027D8C38E|nr:ATP-binding protein [Bacillus horti]
MPIQQNLRVRRNIIIIFFIFVTILITARILWNMSFQSVNQPYAVDGVLDLRDWEAAESRPITLDGEWEIYSHTWLTSHGDLDEQVGNRQLIDVPGSWSAQMDSGQGTPYGYGSYRLQILVNPDTDLNYSLRIPSVRSASALYVNGRLLAQSGELGESLEEYKANNVPYSATFTSNDEAIIEVVIQAANFKDPRNSGIIRSIKFGTERAVASETQLSIFMQQMVAVVFLIHAIYAFILFFVGAKERRLLYFSLLTLSAMFMNILGSEEKILNLWLPISYEWGFKLVALSMIGVAYTLLQCIPHRDSRFWRIFHPIFSILCVCSVILAILLPVRYGVSFQLLYILLITTSIVLALIALLRDSMKNLRNNLLLFLSLTALGSSFAWWTYFLFTGIKVIYYPFDLIIAAACFASIWFKKYFQVNHETQKLAAKLMEADKVKDEFLANTSHELRNPLHGILNMSQAVLERERHSLNERSRRDIGTVISVGRRMSVMLDDLLDSVRLQEKKPRLQYKCFSLQTIVMGVFDMLYFMTKGKPVRLINKIPENFPYIFADENRTIQILFNLLHNALKYTNEGEVTIQGYVKKGRAFITISDTGIGMDAETLNRVFLPYEQASVETTMIEGGFGLGLSISKKLVELQGGELQARSVPDKGTTFIFSLPLAESSQIQEMPKEGANPSVWLDETLATNHDVSTERITFKEDRPRVLLIDDDPVNLNVLETILSAENYDMMTVTSGKKALVALEEGDWDLVITDVMMPHMSGYELTRRIRERFTLTELPILLLTARSQPLDIELGFLSGANDYVTKPVEPLEIKARVMALTEVRKSVRDRIKLEASWLQAQIQPHFLFNTLNAITALSEIDTKRMRKMLDAFSSFLRHKINFRNIDDMIFIEEELSIVRSYLTIEQERFQDRLQVHWEIDHYSYFKIPLLTIQPLVENAVRHGIMKRSRGGEIWIRVVEENKYIRFSVVDNGVGIEETVQKQVMDKSPSEGFGVGLYNTNLRLIRKYGKGLQIESTKEQGTTISFTIDKNNTK